MTRLARGVGDFWFKPEPTSTLALVRIGFGLLVLFWALSLTPDLMSFFSSDGILPQRQDRTVFTLFQPGVWGLLDIFTSDAAIVVLFLALVVGAVALIVGFWTRLAAVVVFLAVLSFERRNPFVFNSGDYLIRNLSFLLLFAPLGASLSVDRLRRARDRFWDFPERAPWALRLVQVQVSILYLTSVWAKVQGETWNAGTAVGFAMRVRDHERFHVPDFINDSATLVNLITYGTLATELALAVLIWNRKARPYVIVAGIAMHAFIDLTLLVGFFSYALFVCYVTFIPPESAQRVIIRVRDRLRVTRVGELSRRRRAQEPVAQMRSGS